MWIGVRLLVVFAAVALQAACTRRCRRCTSAPGADPRGSVRRSGRSVRRNRFGWCAARRHAVERERGNRHQREPRRATPIERPRHSARERPGGQRHQRHTDFQRPELEHLQLLPQGGWIGAARPRTAPAQGTPRIPPRLTPLAAAGRARRIEGSAGVTRDLQDPRPTAAAGWWTRKGSNRQRVGASAQKDVEGLLEACRPAARHEC